MQRKIILWLLFVFYLHAQETLYTVNILSEIGPCSLTINGSTNYSIPKSIGLKKGSYEFHFFNESVDVKVKYDISDNLKIKVNKDQQSYLVLYPGENDFEFVEDIDEYMLNYSGKKNTTKIEDNNCFAIKKINIEDTLIVLSKNGYENQTVSLNIKPYLYYQLIPYFKITESYRDSQIMAIQKRRKNVKKIVIGGLATLNSFFIYKYFESHHKANKYYDDYLDETSPEIITNKYLKYKDEFKQKKYFLIASVANGLILTSAIWLESFTDLSKHLSSNAVHFSIYNDNIGSVYLNLCVGF